MSELEQILKTADVPENRKELNRANVIWLIQHLRRLQFRPAASIEGPSIKGLTKAELIEEITQLDPDASTSGKKADLQEVLTSLRSSKNGATDNATLFKLLMMKLKELR